ncbi:LytTR family DNA-binding domain-containing protein [Cypionkella sp.]|uniref:LytTR family DNA-binding domain-containing protein n=1 Tax=Cypionkella sp. TaxID=2811411 RepID=UPI002605042E|nr:LytTR family DNA-binding domain-containing protein [Cypionkella sp.]
MLNLVFVVYLLAGCVAVKLNVQTMVCTVVAIPAAILAAYGGGYLTVQLGGAQLGDGMICWMCGFNFMTLCVIEVFYAVLLLPRRNFRHSRRSPKLNPTTWVDETDLDLAVRGERSDTTVASGRAPSVSLGELPQGAEAHAQELHIAGHTIKLADLNYISSDQHHILISTSTEPDLFVRARLKDAVSQLPLSLGYSIHRSSWVAWKSVTSVIKEYDRLLVVLADDRRLPVARAKRSEFTEWYNMYRPKPIDRMNS